jgi:hypothetical protein
MMRFAEAVKLLSASFSVQDAFLGELPENAAESRELKGSGVFVAPATANILTGKA